MDITVPFAARAIDAVRSAALDEILPRYRRGQPPRGQDRIFVASHKDDGSLVTEADLAAQRALVRSLTALESVPVLAEEMPVTEQMRIWEGDGRFWCVDPLDGTRNFASGVPFFAVSVALLEARRPILGTVYDPIADEAFYAVRGAGAWLNHKPLNVPRRAPALAQAVAEISLRKDVDLRNAIKHRRPFGKRLTSGSSALSWCHLAAARADLYLHSGQMALDFCAGALILEEAGGLLSSIESDDFWDSPTIRRSVIAARSPELFADWKRWVRANTTCTPH